MNVFLGKGGRTVQVGTRAKSSAAACDDTHPKSWVSVEVVPDLGDVPAGGLVDAVELVGAVDGYLDDVFLGVGDDEVVVVDGGPMPGHIDFEFGCGFECGFECVSVFDIRI